MCRCIDSERWCPDLSVCSVNGLCNTLLRQLARGISTANATTNTTASSTSSAAATFTARVDTTPPALTLLGRGTGVWDAALEAPYPPWYQHPGTHPSRPQQLAHSCAMFCAFKGVALPWPPGRARLSPALQLPSPPLGQPSSWTPCHGELPGWTLGPTLWMTLTATSQHEFRHSGQVGGRRQGPDSQARQPAGTVPVT